MRGFCSGVALGLWAFGTVAPHETDGSGRRLARSANVTFEKLCLKRPATRRVFSSRGMAKTFNSELASLRPAMFRIALKLVRDRDRAEDLVQDAMVKALEYRRSYKPGTNMGAWVHIIMRNICYSQSRLASVRTTVYDDTQALKMMAPDKPPECIEMLDMRAALAALPLNFRQAVMLASAGLAYDEIAVMMGTEVGTVRSRASRGRALLRAALEADRLPVSRFEVTAEAASREMLGEMAPA